MQEYWMNIFDGDRLIHGDAGYRLHADAVDALVCKYPGYRKHQIKVGYVHTLYVRADVPGVPDILQIHDLTDAAEQHAAKLDADEHDGREPRGRNTYDAEPWYDELRRDFNDSVL